VAAVAGAEVQAEARAKARAWLTVTAAENCDKFLTQSKLHLHHITTDGTSNCQEASEGCIVKTNVQTSKLQQQVQHLFTMYMDTEEIHIIHDAVQLLQCKTFSIPNQTKKASIYGAFACGKIIYIASHTDKDYAYSSTFYINLRSNRVRPEV
jgi:hypothetical protein